MEQQSIPTEQVLQAQFAKVGQLEFTIDIMRQQLIALEGENKRLTEKNKKLTSKKKK